jgi:hypothetical protein
MRSHIRFGAVGAILTESTWMVAHGEEKTLSRRRESWLVREGSFHTASAIH